MHTLLGDLRVQCGRDLKPLTSIKAECAPAEYARHTSTQLVIRLASHKHSDKAGLHRSVYSPLKKAKPARWSEKYMDVAQLATVASLITPQTSGSKKNNQNAAGCV